MEPAGFDTINNGDSPTNPLGAHNAPTPHTVQHFDAESGWTQQVEPITGEAPLTIFVNDAEFATVACSPWDLESMAVGFLRSEGILRNRADLQEIIIDPDKGVASVRIDGPTDEDALPCRPVASGAVIDGRTAVALMSTLTHHADLFKLTGGVHCALLADGETAIAYHEDIGRNNVLDRIYGRCFLDGIEPAGKIVVFSGRVSSEVVLKLSKMQVPILISHSAPSALALQLADELGITVLGFTRGNRFNLYTHPERVADAPAQA